MKKFFVFAVFSLLYMSAAVAVFSQEEDASNIAEEGEAKYFDEEETANSKAEGGDAKYFDDVETAYSKAEDGQSAFFLLYSEGAASSWLTRIIKQSGRSNFVFKDYLLGIYFRMDMHTGKNIMPMARIAALYPLETTFNNFPQKSKTPLHIGMDMNLGLNFNILEFKYFRLNAGPSVHLFFLNSDRWNYFELGAAAFTGMELPITERWTMVFNGFASLDNGNLGANRNMEPFDIVYQYQVDIGVRYSKKLKNRTSLFPPKEPVLETPFLMR